MKKLLSLILASIMFVGCFTGCSCSSEPVEQVTPDKLYVENGYTKDDQRVEIKLDTSKNLNTKNNKEYIYDRMLNSLDYLDSVQATYFCVPNTGNAYYSSYAFQQGENPASKEVVLNASSELVTCFLFDGKTTRGVAGDATFIKVDAGQPMIERFYTYAMKRRDSVNIKEYNEKSLYEKNDVNLQELKDKNYAPLVKATSRISSSPDTGANQYLLYENLTMLPMSPAHFAPQNLAFEFLNNFKQWKITGKEERFLRQCLVLEGKATGSYALETNTKKFKMIVDIETGVLISLEGYDKKGKQTLQITTYEFLPNIELNQDLFG